MVERRHSLHSLALWLIYATHLLDRGLWMLFLLGRQKIVRCQVSWRPPVAAKHRTTFDDELLLAQVMRRGYGRAQNSVFHSVVVLVHAFQFLRALSLNVRKSRARKAYSAVSCTTCSNSGISLIRLFDSSHLNIGDLLYDDSPVGILPEGYRQMPGRLKPPRAEIARVYATIISGFT